MQPETRGGTVSLPRRLLTLFLLYTVQGLPYGFLVSVLPLFLRESGWSRTFIGLSSVLGLPWFLKPLWAPLVDRYSFPALGRRKSWVIPCTGLLLACFLLLGTQSPAEGRSLLALFLLVLAINLVTATQDIAVDGLAVDILSPRERGQGNAAQVVGFKAGMLLTGGLLLGLSGTLGWKGISWCMAGITACVLVPAILYPEREGSLREPSTPLTIGEIWRSLLDLARRPGFALALLLIGTYKLGEAGVDAMYKVFLLDGGLSVSRIGVLCGGWGMAFSLAGSLLGGWVAQRTGRLEALSRVGLLRALPLAAIAVLPFLPGPLPLWLLYPVTLAEHLAGGMITPIVFAFMMDLCDKRVGATHYTALSAVELCGKMGMSAASGLLADRIGYGGLFCLGAGISVLWPVLVLVSRKSLRL